MYVVRVEELLQMREAKPHQVLREERLLEEYDPRSSGTAAFVSHQWCSSSHPDPKSAHLAALQGALRGLAAGTLRIDVSLTSKLLFRTRPSVRMRDLRSLSSGCVWYDYFAVPQPRAQAGDSSASLRHSDIERDLGKAIFSIPAYVDACDFFLILAPPVPHADEPDRILDYRSWQERGWCRVERAARALSPGNTHCLLISRPHTISQVSSTEYLTDAGGEGAFTLEADRARVAPVMVMLLERGLQHLLERRCLHQYRRMLSARSSILHSLPGVSPGRACAPGFRVDAPAEPATAEQKLDAFLCLHGFRSAGDRAEGKVDPICFAVRDADLDTMQALLEYRGDPLAREVADEPEHLVFAGATLLHAASMNRAAGPAIIRLLVKRRADIEAKQKGGVTPLMAAAFHGHVGNLAALLELRASVACATVATHLTALHLAALRGQAQACRVLIQAGASAAPTADGVSPTFAAAWVGGGRPTMGVLLAAPDADFETPLRPRLLSTAGVLRATLSLPSLLWGSRATCAVTASQAQGMTPVMVAAMMGNVNEVRELVAAGASLSTRNARGRTAAQLAQLGGIAPLQHMLACLQPPPRGAAVEGHDVEGERAPCDAFEAALPTGLVIELSG